MKISQAEAISLFRKWADEQAPINLIVNIGAAQGSVIGVVSRVENNCVALSHLSGHFQILLTGASFDYGDAREGAHAASEVYPEFVSGLHVIFNLGECIFAELTNPR